MSKTTIEEILAPKPDVRPSARRLEGDQSDWSNSMAGNRGTSPITIIMNSGTSFSVAESLVVARLAGNPNFDKLVREKEEIVAKQPCEEFKQCFSRLVEFLKGYDVANPPALPALKQVKTKPEDWPVGLSVKHPAFGLGTVVKTQGRDDRLEVKVDFGKAGTHKIGVGSCEYHGYGTILEKA